MQLASLNTQFVKTTNKVILRICAKFHFVASTWSAFLKRINVILVLRDIVHQTFLFSFRRNNRKTFNEPICWRNEVVVSQRSYGTVPCRPLCPYKSRDSLSKLTLLFVKIKASLWHSVKTVKRKKNKKR